MITTATTTYYEDDDHNDNGDHDNDDDDDVLDEDPARLLHLPRSVVRPHGNHRDDEDERHHGEHGGDHRVQFGVSVTQVDIAQRLHAAREFVDLCGVGA